MSVDSLQAALRRSMPLTRMLDYGMDYVDATRIHADVEAGAAWDRSAEDLAATQLEAANAAAGAGLRLAAGERFRAAGVSLVFAQMALNFDDDRKRELYAGLVSCFQRAAAQELGIELDRVCIPYRDSELVCWSVSPRAVGPAPVVIVVGGQSGWGCAYLPLAETLARRGMATLLAELPGQGETRLFNDLYLDERVDEALAAVAEHALASTRFGDRVGVWGNSFGGLFAALAAARHDHITACCVNGAYARPRIPEFRMAAEQGAAMIGREAVDARVEAVFDALRLDPRQERIGCPVLILHGGADPLIRREDQEPFAAAGSEPTWLEWEDGEHTIYNHARERAALVADWFAAALGVPA
jgi:alpha-beta hydrolase superfamily lysophospholipase